MDNLNTNDAMMKEIEKILADREIPFDAKDSRIMCFPHIVNIIVQCVLAEMTSASESEQNTNNPASDSDPEPIDEDQPADQRGRTQTFATAFSTDPIGRRTLPQTCCKASLIWSDQG